VNRFAALAREPSLERLGNPVLRLFLATRPAFLSITLVGCLLGQATALAGDYRFQPVLLLLILLLAALAHAGVNVFNDYYDHLNGSDAANQDRLYPYTGGSRFIQNQLLTPDQTLAFAILLFVAVIAGGLLLIGLSGAGLFWIGLAGLFIGWAYSAPPFRLNSRGLGEVCVAVGFLLVVVGADYVQRGEFAALPWLAGLPYALLTTSILYINQFPDRRADARAGKRHWVVRLRPAWAAWGYALIAALALAWLVAMVLAGALTAWVLLAALPFWFSVRAARQLLRYADDPAQLRPAIGLTLAAAHAHAGLLALILVLGHLI
jgi:1,4-dihydroxy-2-naphthoate octaprenyltransferase